MTPRHFAPRPRRRRSLLLATAALAAASTVVAAGVSGASGANDSPLPSTLPPSGFLLVPGNLLVSMSTYGNHESNVTVGQTLPPGCSTGCGTATANGAYPQVFNNDLADSSFGVSAPIEIEEMTPTGFVFTSTDVPIKDMVTSFSSKSELALNLSTDRGEVTFMGYAAPINTLDVSNSNTPMVLDPTNPDPSTYYRVVGQLDAHGWHFTLTNAYSGNNGRAALLNNSNGANVVYLAGNAGNGGNPQPNGVIVGAGAQIATAQTAPEALQSPGLPTPVGSFSITQLGDKADKVGKDTNFRGLTEFNNVLYFTKGSGGNGVNTVYFIDTVGGACPNGTGLPIAGAPLPTSGINYNPALLQTKGVTPTNMCILKGFPTTLAKATTDSFPFGIWFANPTTMYVAEEGDGNNAYSSDSGTFDVAAAQTFAGLQKWELKNGVWTKQYTLQAGLNLGQPYTVAHYPTGDNPATGLPWSPATDGLRNLTGRVNPDGTATIWAVTSTVSGSGDQGADPNKLVAITDSLGATTASPNEAFTTLQTAGFGQVLRGVSFTPGTPPTNTTSGGASS